MDVYTTPKSWPVCERPALLPVLVPADATGMSGAARRNVDRTVRVIAFVASAPAMGSDANHNSEVSVQATGFNPARTAPPPRGRPR